MTDGGDGPYVAAASLNDLETLGHAFKNGDKELQKGIRTGLQKAGQPLATETIRAGAARMPHRGGLSARLADGKGAVSVSLSGKNVSVSIRLTNRSKDSLRGLDSGKLRHPVFGEKRAQMGASGELRSPWVSQTVPASAFSDAYKAGAPIARADLARAIDGALERIAKEAES